MTDTVVLCYHAVSSQWRCSLSVSPEDLAWQIDFLLGRGYRGVTFSDAVTHADSPGRRFAVTFDDAYASVFANAWPVLSGRDVPATVFAPTSFIDADEPMSWPGISQWATGPMANELLPMSWVQLRELNQHGWEVGSHTSTHPRLTTLDDRELAAELEDSRRICESHLAVPCRSLAYPYGDHDDRVIDASSAAGYSTACTLPSRFHQSEPLRWPRVGIYPPDGRAWRFRLKVSPWARRLRGTSLWP